MLATDYTDDADPTIVFLIRVVRVIRGLKPRSVGPLLYNARCECLY
jgi:hypothetical protein